MERSQTMYTFIFLALIILLLTIPFSLYHLIVASLAITQRNFNRGIKCMFIGNILTMLSLFLQFYIAIMLEIYLPILPLILWIIGVSLICYGAYWNDKQKGNIKNSHHIIRISLAVLLTFILLLI